MLEPETAFSLHSKIPQHSALFLALGFLEWMKTIGKNKEIFRSHFQVGNVSGGNHTFRENSYKSRPKSRLNSPKKSHM
jgi:hypothetical protein